MRIDAHQHFWRYRRETHGWISDRMAVLNHLLAVKSGGAWGPYPEVERMLNASSAAASRRKG